jgi:hypothetical protein
MSKNSKVTSSILFFAESTPSPKDFDLSGSFLPDVFPDGDPSQYALPVQMS